VVCRRLKIKAKINPAGSIFKNKKEGDNPPLKHPYYIFINNSDPRTAWELLMKIVAYFKSKLGAIIPRVPVGIIFS